MSGGTALRGRALSWVLNKRSLIKYYKWLFKLVNSFHRGLSADKKVNGKTRSAIKDNPDYFNLKTSLLQCVIKIYRQVFWLSWQFFRVDFFS
jgi:hypothetical protein